MLAVGVTAITVILIAGKGLPSLAMAKDRLLATSSHERLGAERTRQLAERAAEIRATADTSLARLARLTRSAFPGATPAEAAASLSMLVEEYAALSKVRITSTTTRSDTLFSKPFPRISSRFHATADVQGILELLARLESSDHMIAVREFTLTQPEPAAAESAPESLRVELVVEALAREGTAIAGPRI